MMFNNKKLLDRLDQMLEDGINGTFTETSYDESRLSSIESKWYRYLTSSKLSSQKINLEREKIKELVTDISHQTKTPLDYYFSVLLILSLSYTASFILLLIIIRSRKYYHININELFTKNLL